jgi:hypothetical protein
VSIAPRGRAIQILPRQVGDVTVMGCSHHALQQRRDPLDRAVAHDNVRRTVQAARPPIAQR